MSDVFGHIPDEIATLRAEIERLRGELHPEVTITRNANGFWGRTAARLVEDLDKARAEIERLTKERDAAIRDAAIKEESLDDTCEICDGACPHRRDR